MRHTRDSRTGRPVPYFVLHRIGFSLPSASLPARWALTPPFHPYPAEVTVRVKVKVDFSPFTPPFHSHSPPGGIFSVALSVTAASPAVPRLEQKRFRPAALRPTGPARQRFLPGILPKGVRTFLSEPPARPGLPRNAGALGAALPAPSGCFQRTERRSGPKTKPGMLKMETGRSKTPLTTPNTRSGRTGRR